MHQHKLVGPGANAHVPPQICWPWGRPGAALKPPHLCQHRFADPGDNPPYPGLLFKLNNHASCINNTLVSRIDTALCAHISDTVQFLFAQNVHFGTNRAFWGDRIITFASDATHKLTSYKPGLSTVVGARQPISKSDSQQAENPTNKPCRLVA